jgi:Flp pilus assembly protein TadD
MGILFLMRKDFGSAIDVFRKTLGLAPEDETARYHLALSYLATGEQPKAEMEFERLLLLNPQHINVRTDLAVLLLSKGELEKALQELIYVLEIDPAYDKAIYYHGVLLYYLDRKTEAATILDNLQKSTSPEYSEKARLFVNKYINQ